MAQTLREKYAACARDILKTGAGEEPPPNFPTKMLEEAIIDIVEKRMPDFEAGSYFSICFAAAYANRDKGRKLTHAEADEVIQRHFPDAKLNGPAIPSI